MLSYHLCVADAITTREDPLDAMRLILTNESNLIVQGNALDLVRKLLHPTPTERLGAFT
jgi:hypothetical protein